MREVRVTVPEGHGERLAALAVACGATSPTVYRAYGYGEHADKQVVSVETSTPTARRFFEAVLALPAEQRARYTLTTRTLRSIESRERVEDLTQPLALPEPDLWQELWESSHITASYVGRMAVASLLLAYAMIHNSVLLLIGALLFTQFLPHLLAVGFGAGTRDWRLARQGAMALAAGTAIAFASGFVVGSVTDASFRFSGFNEIGVTAIIAAGIGVAAGLASGDDAGERPLIGLAAAGQYSIYPVWLGIFAARGFEQTTHVAMRAASMGVSAALILLMATLTYRALGMRSRGEGLPRLPRLPHLRWSGGRSWGQRSPR
ncbi:MAG: hypothetical protein HYX50_04270 [Chloroflexi bacterium]|nr:hypothetical protein [Chloroflexota bacterium]